jgi:UDP-N-acetyl-D-galactosamine dehydrogenase
MNDKFQEKQIIAVIGLGYVGLPLAVEFGKKRRVIGFDINSNRIFELKNGYDRTFEIASKDLKAAKYLEFTNESAQLKVASTYVITVPTPIDLANRPDLGALISASKTVGSVLKNDDTVIYESTVYPGCTEEICVPVLESASGLKVNKDFSIGYSPERINPGDKVYTLSKIKKITSGSNDIAANQIDLLYREIIEAGTWLAPSIKVAEAAKVIENSQRDLNIAFVNELSMLFDRMGIDTMDVLEAAGSKWNFLPFKPGMVGGHCIGVDPYYLTHKAEELGYHPEIILAGRRINDNMASYAASSIVKRMLHAKFDISKSTVGVMGITFKENCPDIRNSKVIDLIKELQAWGLRVVVTDPWANSDEVREEFGISLEPIDHHHPVDALVIAVGHKEYRDLDINLLKSYCRWDKSPLLADLKSLYRKSSLENAGFKVFRL